MARLNKSVASGRRPSVWTGDDENKWLGWLNSPARPNVATSRKFRAARGGTKVPTPSYSAWAARASAPRVLAETFTGNPASRSARARLTPIRHRYARWSKVDISKTLFIVSSKSGGTTEPNVMKDYFFDRVSKAISAAKADHRFIAVTDPGSSLEKVARKRGFARIFYGDPTIGGRYSVLSPFGLVPAAAAGIDVRGLIKHTLSMVRSCGADHRMRSGVQLGLAIGLAGLEGRDKVTIASSRKITGSAPGPSSWSRVDRQGWQGLIPIDGEPLGDPSLHGNDRFFIDLRTEGENDAAHDEKLAALEQAGHPVSHVIIDR